MRLGVVGNVIRLVIGGCLVHLRGDSSATASMMVERLPFRRLKSLVGLSTIGNILKLTSFVELIDLFCRYVIGFRFEDCLLI